MLGGGDFETFLPPRATTLSQEGFNSQYGRENHSIGTSVDSFILGVTADERGRREETHRE
jgi:hypothetical protein